MKLPYAEVIGDPISHSKSPLIHNFWLEKLGIAAEYRACHVKPESLANYIAVRRADPMWRGCNVTIPHKIAIMQHIDNIEDFGLQIGAINTVFRSRHGNELLGNNTDSVGFGIPLHGVSLQQQTVVIIGSGGATNAILWGLAAYQIGEFVMIARNTEKARELLNRLNLNGRVLSMESSIPSAQLLVNTTSLGMVGQPPLVTNLCTLPSDAYVYDIVYTPLDTPLLVEARRLGLRTIDGLAMLIGQAAAAFSNFFGEPAPLQHNAELRALLTA